MNTLTPAEIAITEAIALGVGEELTRRGVRDKARFLVHAATRDDGGLDVVVHDSFNKGAAVARARVGPVTGCDVQTGMTFRAVGVDLGARTYACTYQQTE